MTDQDLRALLREHIDATEPPFTLDPAVVTAASRTGRARRVVGLGAAGLIAASIAGTVVVNLPDDTGAGRDRTTQGIDPVTERALEEYDASAMPELVDASVRAAVGDRIDLGERRFSVADDCCDQQLPEDEWDRAASMTTRYGMGTVRQVDVYLAHARSLTEGGACQEPTGTRDAWEVSCEATTLAGGTVVETTVAAVYPDPVAGSGGWMALTPRNLESGKLPYATLASPEDAHLDWDKVYFRRTVKAVHSETFLSVVSEAVVARTLEEALKRFALSVEVLTQIATDPALVIPRPAESSDASEQPGLYGGTDEANVSTAAEMVLSLFVTLERDGMMPDRVDEAFLAEIGAELPHGASLEIYTMHGSGKDAEIDVCIEHRSGAWAVASTESRALRSDVTGGCPVTDRG